jgi:hypothetical protein
MYTIPFRTPSPGIRLTTDPGIIHSILDQSENMQIQGKSSKEQQIGIFLLAPTWGNHCSRIRKTPEHKNEKKKKRHNKIQITAETRQDNRTARANQPKAFVIRHRGIFLLVERCYKSGAGVFVRHKVRYKVGKWCIV